MNLKADSQTLALRSHPIPEGWRADNQSPSLGAERDSQSGQMSEEPTAKGRMFVPTESLWESLHLAADEDEIREESGLKVPWWPGRKRMTQSFIDSLELFTYSPGLELPDEHQETSSNTTIQKYVQGRLAALPAGSSGCCRT